MRLSTFAEDAERRAARQIRSAGSRTGRTERDRADAAGATDLRAFVLGLIDDLDEAAEGTRSWQERAQWAGRHLNAQLGEDRRRAHWPAAESRAVDRVAGQLERLASLTAIEGPIGLDVFTQTLELELGADFEHVGRMGEGVLVGPVAMGIGLDLDLVVVLGLAEGSFPSRAHDDVLLPDRERRSAAGELALRSDGPEREHHQLLASLAGATGHLLCIPRGDLRRSCERVPSRWVLQLAGALAGKHLSAEDLAWSQWPWLTQVASFDAGLRNLVTPATQQEHRLRSRLALGPAGSGTGGNATDDPIFDSGMDLLRARRSRRFTRFDGNLGGLRLPSPVGEPASATRLEAWAACPFRYLLEHVLGVEPIENPEEQLQMTARDRGLLFHKVLERFVAEVLARPTALRPGPDQPWSEGDFTLMRDIAEAECAEYETRGLTGRSIFWRRDKRQILADLREFLIVDTEQRSVLRTRPVAVEASFGLPESPEGPVCLRLPDGRPVLFRGKIDRIDVAEDGSLHVLDYKTGRDSPYRGLSATDPTMQGQNLQLAVYAVAACVLHDQPDAPVRADYWFTSARGRFTRIGYPVTPETLQTVSHTLALVVAAIEEGVFPAHPSATSTQPWIECPYCDPDGLGVVELRMQFERKLDDPAMRPYAELVSGSGVSGGLRTVPADD
jgi:hypothetical protein